MPLPAIFNERDNGGGIQITGGGSVAPQSLFQQKFRTDGSGLMLTGQGAATGTASGAPDLGVGDINKAGEGAELLKSRYIDQNPYEKYLESARTGTMAMLGRQEEINRGQLEAGLQRMGPGVNALRRTGARAGLDTEIAYRYMAAEKGLGELGMASADRAQNALNDYIGAYLNMAGRRQGAYSAYWNKYSQNKGNVIRTGGKSTAGDGKAWGVGGLSQPVGGTQAMAIKANPSAYSSGGSIGNAMSDMWDAARGGNEIGSNPENY